MSRTDRLPKIIQRLAEHSAISERRANKVTALLWSDLAKLKSMYPNYWRDIRENAGLTLAQVADMANTQISVVHHFERVKSNVSLTVSKTVLARLIGVYNTIKDADLCPWNLPST